MEEDQVVEKLRTALNLVKTLKNENENLKEHLEEVINCMSSDHVKRDQVQAALCKKEETLSKELELLLCEKVALENEYKTSSQNWKAQMNEMTRKIETMKLDALSPKELEILKLKIRNEVEKETQKKWIMQDEEINKFRDLYYQLRKEYEVFKCNADTQVSHLETLLKDTRSSHEEEIMCLQTKMNNMQASLIDTSELERLRSAQRQNSELTLKNQVLLQEISEVRAQKEAMKIEYEQRERLSQRKILEETSIAKALSVEKESLRNQLNSLENEHRKTADALEASNQEVYRVSLELDKSKSRNEELQHQYVVEINDLKSNMIKEKNYSQNVISDLNKQIADNQSTIKNLKETINQLKLKASDLEREATERMKGIKEEEWARISRLEAEKADLEASLATLRELKLQVETKENQAHSEMHADLNKYKIQLREYLIKNEEYEKRITKLTKEKDEAHSRVETLLQKLEDLQDKQLHKRMELEKDQMQKVESKVQEYKLECDRLSDLLEKERIAHSHNLERYKTLLNKERYNFKKHKENWEDDNRILEAQVQELKMILDETKEKTKQKITDYKKKMKRYKTASQELRSSLSLEKVQKEQDEVNQIKQRQAQLLQILEDEGLFQM